MEGNLKNFSAELLTIRKEHRTIKPVKNEAHKFVNELLQLLFPHFTEHIYYTAGEIESKIVLLTAQFKVIINCAK